MKTLLITKDKFTAERFGGLADNVYSSYADMSEKIKVSKTDVVIVDLNACEPFDMTKLGCASIALVGVPKFEEAVILMGYGIRGYGNRMMMKENLESAVNAVKSGQLWIPPEFISRLITSIPQTEKKAAFDMNILTEREQEVARLVAEGLSNAEIAEKTNITIRTVKAHMTSILIKTGLRDRVALAVALR